MKNNSFIDLHTCIQGEGKLAGIPHVLIRTTGCNLKCVFSGSICDTPYSSHKPEKAKFSVTDWLMLMNSNPHITNVMLTGGEPTLNEDLVRLIYTHCNMQGWKLTIETNATKFIELPSKNLLISLSPKLDSSSNKKDKHIRIQPNVIQKYLIHNETQIKFVVTSKEDLTQIKEIQKEVGIPNQNIYLMAEGISEEQLSSRRKMIEKLCIENGYNYTDRLHILIHGNKRES